MGWFSRDKEQAPAAATVVTSAVSRGTMTNVRFQSGLMPEYLATHDDIKHLFQQIQRLVDEGNFERIPDALTAFKTALESHILSENIRFYGYLEQQFKGDDNTISLIKSFRTEMNTISHQLVAFVKRWRDQGVSAVTASAFIADYKLAAIPLARRFDAEERDLYPLYQPPL